MAVDPDLGKVVNALMGGADVRETLTAYAEHLKKLADEAWNGAANLSKTETEQTWARAQAHAYCEALGDQPNLFSDLRMWEWRDQGEPEGKTDGG